MIAGAKGYAGPRACASRFVAGLAFEGDVPPPRLAVPAVL